MLGIQTCIVALSQSVSHLRSHIGLQICNWHETVFFFNNPVFLFDVNQRYLNISNILV